MKSISLKRNINTITWFLVMTCIFAVTSVLGIFAIAYISIGTNNVLQLLIDIWSVLTVAPMKGAIELILTVVNWLIAIAFIGLLIFSIIKKELHALQGDLALLVSWFVLLFYESFILVCFPNGISNISDFHYLQLSGILLLVFCTIILGLITLTLSLKSILKRVLISDLQLTHIVPEAPAVTFREPKPIKRFVAFRPDAAVSQKSKASKPLSADEIVGALSDLKPSAVSPVNFPADSKEILAQPVSSASVSPKKTAPLIAKKTSVPSHAPSVAKAEPDEPTLTKLGGMSDHLISSADDPSEIESAANEGPIEPKQASEALSSPVSLSDVLPVMPKPEAAVLKQRKASASPQGLQPSAIEKVATREAKAIQRATENKIGAPVRIPFALKLNRASPELQAHYQAIRAALLSYGVKSRISIDGDTYRLHNDKFAIIAVVGKKIKVYFPLHAKDYVNSSIPLEDCSHIHKYADTPSAFSVRSDLSLKRVMTLIDDVMNKKGKKKKGQRGSLAKEEK